MNDAHQDTEQGVVKEDVGEKISASGRGYTSTCKQGLQRTQWNDVMHAALPSTGGLHLVTTTDHQKRIKTTLKAA